MKLILKSIAPLKIKISQSHCSYHDEFVKFKFTLDGIDMKVKQVNKLNPRFLVRDISADVDRQRFVKDPVKKIKSRRK